jgi:hypothetical protein
MSGLLFSGRVEVDVTDFPSHRHSLHQFLPLSPDKKAAYPSQFKLALPDRRRLQSVTKSLKNVARAFWVPVFLTKIVCDLWIRQHIPYHAYSRARRLHPI